MQTFTTIEVEDTAPVAWLRFNRPERHNTVTATMMEEMHAALTTIQSRDDVKVLVLTGNGRAFCPGADLQRESDEPPRLPDAYTYQTATLLHDLPAITIAAVNGACAGAGFAWASACDLRVAARSARFSLAFLDVGVAGELGLAWTLQHHLGSSLARELFLLPRKFSAQDAADLHFVHRVFEDDTFASQLTALVGELAGRDAQALRDIKANFLAAESMPLPNYIDLETARHQARFTPQTADQTLARFAARHQALNRPALDQ